jgi:hypothetical protein
VREQQIALLADDGIAVAPDGKIRGFDALFFPIDDRSTGVRVLPRG